MMLRYLALPSSTWGEERSEAMRCLARMQPDKKMAWLDKARIEAPHRRETWLDLAEEFHGQSDWLNLFWAATNGIEKTHRTGSYLDDPHCWGVRLFDLGAIAAWHLNAMDRAVDWGQKALDLDPGNQRLKNNLDFFIRRREEVRAQKASSLPTQLSHSDASKPEIVTSKNAPAKMVPNQNLQTASISTSPERSFNAKSVFDRLNVQHEFKRLNLTSDSQPTSLCGLMSSFGSYKTGPFHNYTVLYERLFSKFREEELSIFELGLGTNKVGASSTMGPHGKPGASLRAWRAYFNSALIYGADIDNDILFHEDRIQTFYVDQQEP
jgi:hypothetical protein